MLINYQRELVIDHRSTVPIAEQLYHQYENLISSTKTFNRQPLISEAELEKIIDVKRSVIEKVYRKLEKNNYIYFDENHKAFVAKRERILDFFKRLVLIEDGIRAMGKEPSVEVTSFEVVKMNQVFRQIGDFKDDRFLKRGRLYYADKIPYIYLEEYYPLEKFPSLETIQDTSDSKVVEKILLNDYHVQFTKNKRSIKVQLIDKDIAQLLRVKKGLSGFKIDMVYLDQHNESFGFGYAYSLPYFYFEYHHKIK